LTQDIYLILPEPAISPAAVLDGLSRYVRANKGARKYRLRPCLCGGTTTTPECRDTPAAGQLVTLTLGTKKLQVSPVSKYSFCLQQPRIYQQYYMLSLDVHYRHINL